MYEILLNLEKDFFKYDKITDKKWLDSILHNNFKEIGKSGSIYNKNDITESFLMLKSDRYITIYNFEICAISTNCWLAHYITSDNGKIFYRTSVWLDENGLKLIFHQASELKSYTQLKKC